MLELPFTIGQFYFVIEVMQGLLAQVTNKEE
jgi:hypothetical protein